MILTDYHLMPFGKYAGRRVIEVPAVYLLWLFNNGINHPDVKEYILANLEVLKKEASKVKR